MTPEQLVDLEEIKALKHRYMRLLDQKRFEEMRDVFTPDAKTRYSAGKYSHDGVDSIIEFLVESMSSDGFLSSHRVSQPEIELIDADTANGTWAFDDHVVMEDFGLSLRGAGFYQDEYIRTEAGWRIRRTGYKRTFEEVYPRASIDGLKVTASYWGTGGRSTL